jgi:hypothetical protein
MPRSSREAPSRDTDAEHARRDQEVLRANRELAAYFKGHRTEREAKAALKIIKAYVRERGRMDPRKLRPLPGAKAPLAARPAKERAKIRVGRRPVRRATADALTRNSSANSIEPITRNSDEDL